jgi:hypothetical protein
MVSKKKGGVSRGKKVVKSSHGFSSRNILIGVVLVVLLLVMVFSFNEGEEEGGLGSYFRGVVEGEDEECFKIVDGNTVYIDESYEAGNIEFSCTNDDDGDAGICNAGICDASGGVVVDDFDDNPQDIVCTQNMKDGLCDNEDDCNTGDNCVESQCFECDWKVSTADSGCELDYYCSNLGMCEFGIAPECRSKSALDSCAGGSGICVGINEDCKIIETSCSDDGFDDSLGGEYDPIFRDDFYLGDNIDDLIAEIDLYQADLIGFNSNLMGVQGAHAGQIIFPYYFETLAEYEAVSKYAVNEIKKPLLELIKPTNMAGYNGINAKNTAMYIDGFKVQPDGTQFFFIENNLIKEIDRKIFKLNSRITRLTISQIQNPSVFKTTLRVSAISGRNALINARGLSISSANALRTINNQVLYSVRNPTVGCGGAGVYNILQPLARPILRFTREKVPVIAVTGAAVAALVMQLGYVHEFTVELQQYNQIYDEFQKSSAAIDVIIYCEDANIEMDKICLEFSFYKLCNSDKSPNYEALNKFADLLDPDIEQENIDLVPSVQQQNRFVELFENFRLLDSKCRIAIQQYEERSATVHWLPFCYDSSHKQ